MNICDLTPSEQLEVKGTLYGYCDANIYDKLYTDFEHSSTYVMPLKKYNKLAADSQFLDALYAAGVDSWEGFEQAQEIYEGEDN